MTALSRPERIILVLDKTFGKKLHDFDFSSPLWLRDSCDNHPVYEELCRRADDVFPKGRFATWLTLVEEEPRQASDSDWLEELIVEIEIHHGEWDQEIPWRILEVHGMHLTPEVTEVLEVYHLFQREPTSDGFIAYLDKDARLDW